MGFPKDKKPKKTYTLNNFAKKELRKQQLSSNENALKEGLKNASFSYHPVDTTTFEPPLTQNVTQTQPIQQTEATDQPQNYLLQYGNSGLPNSEVSTLLGSVLTGQTQQNLYDNVSHSLGKMKEGAESLNLDNAGLNYNNALAGLKFMNGLAGLSFFPITAVNEVMKQNPVTEWLNKGAMLPFELADELYTLTQKGTDYAFEKITGHKPDRSDPLSQELDEFLRTSTQLLIGGKAFHETGKFFKKGMPEEPGIKQMSYDEYKNTYDKEPQLININLPEFQQFRENNPTLLLSEKAGADFYATPDGQIITLTDYEKPAKNVTNGMTQEEIKLSQKNISGEKLTAKEQSKINFQITDNADLTETDATGKKPYEEPATIIGEQPKQNNVEIDLGNKRRTFTKIINEFDKDLQTIEQKLASGEITKAEFDELEKQYNETENKKKTWQKRLDEIQEEPKPIETVTENKRPSNDIYSEENIKNPQYPDRTNEVTEQPITEEVTEPTEVLSEKEFNKKYKAQHKDVRSKTEDEKLSVKGKIVDEGFNQSMNVNALPIFKKPDNAVSEKYGNKKGDIIYLLPKDAIEDKPNGYQVKKGHKPLPSDIIRIEYDNQPTYEAYKKQILNKLKTEEVVTETKQTETPTISLPKAEFENAKEIADKLEPEVEKLNEKLKVENSAKLPEAENTAKLPKTKQEAVEGEVVSKGKDLHELPFNEFEKVIEQLPIKNIPLDAFNNFETYDGHIIKVEYGGRTVYTYPKESPHLKNYLTSDKSVDTSADQIDRFLKRHQEDTHSYDYKYKLKKRITEQALSEGKTVPEEVLKDYPELKTKEVPSEKPTLEQKKEIRRQNLAEKKGGEGISEQQRKANNALENIYDFRERVNGLKKSDTSGRANRSKNIVELKKAVSEFNAYSPESTAKIRRSSTGNYIITIDGKPLRREAIRQEFNVKAEADKVDNPEANKSFKELGAEERETQRNIASDLDSLGTKMLKEKFKFDTPAKVLKKGLQDIKDDSGKETSPEAIVTRDEMLEQSKAYKDEYKSKAENNLNKTDESDIPEDADTSFNFGENAKKKPTIKTDDSDTKIKISQLEKRKKDLQDKLASGELDKEGSYKTTEKTDTSEQPDFFGKAETQSKLDLSTERDINEVRKREARKEIKIIDDEINKLKQSDYNSAKQTIKDALSKDSGISFGGLSKLGDLADPKVLKAVYDVGRYHYGNFKDFSKKVIEDVGDWVKPHLRNLYNEITKDRTGLDNINKFGIDFLKANHNLKSDKSVFTVKSLDKSNMDFDQVNNNLNEREKKSKEEIFLDTEFYGDDIQKLKNSIKNKELRFYTITLHTPEHSFRLNDKKYLSLKDAIEDFDNIHYSDFDQFKDHSNLSAEINNNYIDPYKNELEKIELYLKRNANETLTVSGRELMEEMIKDKVNYDYEDPIDTRSVTRANEVTDEILRDVQNHYGGKYNLIELNDGDYLKLRIADHSGNRRNNEYGHKNLSIVISNENPTKRFNRDLSKNISNELYFDDTAKKEDIIDAIDEYINDLNNYNAKQTIKDALSKDSGISFGGLSKLGDLADPKVLKAVYDVAKYHTGKFAEWSKKVIADVGNWIKPHLRNLYQEITKDRTGLNNVVTQGLNLKPIKQEVKESFSGAVDKIKRGADTIRKIIAPVTRGENAKLTAKIITEKNAELVRQEAIISEGFKEARKQFDKRSNADNLKMIDAIETGSEINNPLEKSFAEEVRKLLDAEYKKVTDRKGVKSFIENYFPHIWEQDSQNQLQAMLSRRPLEGSKSFLKKRTIPTTREGIEAGLKPVTYNPVDLALLKLHEMKKFNMAHEIMDNLKAEGLVKYIPTDYFAPAGWTKLNDKIGTIFGDPGITATEYVDKHLYNALEKLATDLNIKHSRVAELRGTRMGEASPLGYINTKYATPEDVLAHEIGHHLQFKYNLWDYLTGDIHVEGRNKTDTLKKTRQERVKIHKELRALADLRAKGEKVSDSHKRYLREKDEKMAVVLQAYTHIPAEMREVAPTIFSKFEKFIDSKPQLQQIKQIKPSLVPKGMDMRYDNNGILIKGHYYLPEPATRIINNYLSPGLKGEPIFDIYRGISNTLNQVQLGASLFHASFTSGDANLSKLALGLMKISRGKKEGLLDIATSPIAFITNPVEGNKIRKDYLSDRPNNPELVNAITRAGGRISMDRFYTNDLYNTVKKAFKDGKYISGSLKSPFAMFEVLSKPVLEYLVPRQKLGVFSGLAKDILQDEASGKLTKTEATERLQEAWRSVDNRMGQLVYDNLYWDHVVKDIAMASVRSVGWNLGTFRELGGGIRDIPKIITEKRLTPRTAYALALPFGIGLLGAVYSYLNGTPAESIKDLYFPRTGHKNKDGVDDRISLPSYMKDVFAYGTDIKSALNTRDLGTGAKTLSHKMHPAISMLLDLINNHDYFGNEISDNTPFSPEWFVDEAKYIAKQFRPFTVNNISEMNKQGESLSKQLQSFFGFQLAPGYIRRSDMQNKIYDTYQKRNGEKIISKPEAETRELKRELKDLYLKDKNAYDEKIADLLEEGKISSRELNSIESDKPTDIKLFKYLPADDKIELWNQMNKEEKQRYQDGLTNKIRKTLNLPYKIPSNAPKGIIEKATPEQYTEYENEAEKRIMQFEKENKGMDKDELQKQRNRIRKDIREEMNLETEKEKKKTHLYIPGQQNYFNQPKTFKNHLTIPK